MRSKILSILAATVAMSAPAYAKEYALQLKSLAFDEAMQGAGGYGTYAQLLPKKPATLKSEPKAVSGQPIYGELQMGSNLRMLFRVDESKGQGKGYDRLLLDLNQNSDLTDDAVISRNESNQNANQNTDVAGFGPIQAPASLCVGQWKPIYYAQMYVYNRNIGTMGGTGTYIGNMRLKSGSYLEAQIDLDGKTERLGLLDGNCNLKLGDVSKPTMYNSSEGSQWYFAPGDFFLRDKNHNGRFDNDQCEQESEFLSNLIYFNGKPYNITISPDYDSVKVESYSSDMATLDIQPKGAQIKQLVVAHEAEKGNWRAFHAGVVEGKVKVPPGNYRLYSCVVGGENASKNLVMAGGYQRVTTTPVKAESGKEVVLKCGGPIELQVTAQKQQGGRTSSGGLMDAAISLFAGTGSSTPPELRINMTAKGAGGEVYSGFQSGTSGRSPVTPSFKVFGDDGKQVASGNLEFG